MADRTAQKLEQLTTNAKEQLLQTLTKLGVEITTPFTTIPSHWLHTDELRMDASYYTNDVFTALRLIEDSPYPVKSLGQIVDEVFILGRFRRIYATNEDAGWPYLSASEALTFRPISDRLIAKDHAPRESARHFAREGWILLSCSGSVGRAVLVSKRLERYFLTHDLARIVPRQSPFPGYLYAFLSSWIGQALLSKDQYGSAIKHLESHHIAGLPVPILPETEQQAIHEEIEQAYALRDEANSLLDEALQMLHDDLGLPNFDESLVPYLSFQQRQTSSLPEMPHPRAFTVKLSELDDRFDASYHVPIAKTVIALLQKGKYPLTQLGHLAESIYIPPRFKRIYIRSKEHGIPFLRPSHLPQTRPYDLGYISKLTEVLTSLLFKDGDVLVTTDGTVGNIALVSSYIQGWAGSNNIARISYGNLDGRNGYLAAFLMSPYGYYQLTREIYGGVVDHIEVPHIENVWIPDAPIEKQQAIGQCVVRAFQMKGEATVIEEAAIHRLEVMLETPASDTAVH